MRNELIEQFNGKKVDDYNYEFELKEARHSALHWMNKCLLQNHRSNTFFSTRYSQLLGRIDHLNEDSVLTADQGGTETPQEISHLNLDTASILKELELERNLRMLAEDSCQKTKVKNSLLF